jgi:hypothetical protein
MAELTVRLREAALRAFARWLVEVGEPAEHPLLGLTPPKPHKRAVALTSWCYKPSSHTHRAPGTGSDTRR